MASICLAICGITTRVNLISTDKFHKDMQKRYRNFLHAAHNRTPDINLSIKTINNNRNAAETVPSVELMNKTLRIRGSGIACNISCQNRLWQGAGSIEENIYRFDTLLRLLYSHLLIKNGGFLIHACGIRHKNKGYLFAGRSGSGKTTIARKAPYRNVLSDELVGLRLRDKKPLLMGTPFWGEFQKGGQPVFCALKGVYFLGKDTRPKLAHLPPALALKKLLKLVLFFGRGSHSGIIAQKILDLSGKYLLSNGAYQVNLAKNTPYKTILKIVSRNGNK